MSQNKFCCIILTHGRADSMITHKTLRAQGYTGEIFFLIDNEDKQAEEYRERFGDSVVMFDKLEVDSWTDTGDLDDSRKVVLFARNAAFAAAKEKGYEYFIQLDDDYSHFGIMFDQDFRYITTNRRIDNLDHIFQLIVDYYASIPALTISLSQTGDFIGGESNTMLSAVKVKRKAMNSFFCSTKREFKFFGRINEDVNLYTHDGRQGKLIFQLCNLALQQGATQQNAGGMTDIYLDSGTYLKTFYSVMYSPSCVKVATMGAKDRRLHHNVEWKYATPMILSEKHRKDGHNASQKNI